MPLKLGKWFEGMGIGKECVVELDWWQQTQHKETKVTVALTPAQVRPCLLNASHEGHNHRVFRVAVSCMSRPPVTTELDCDTDRAETPADARLLA